MVIGLLSASEYLREFWSDQTLWGRLGCKYLRERDGDYKSSVCGNWSRESQGLSRPPRTRVKHFGQERNKVAQPGESQVKTPRAVPHRSVLETGVSGMWVDVYPPPFSTDHHADSTDNRMVGPAADLWRTGERVKYYCSK